MRIDQIDKPTLLLAGMVAENLKDYSAAAKWLSKASELVDQHPEAQLALSRSYYKLGQREDARKVLGKISSRTQDAKFIFWAGQEAFLAQDYDTAEALFLSIQPSYSDKAALGYAIARLQYQTRRYLQAQKTLSDLTAKGPAGGDTYSLLGWRQFRQGQFHEAVRALERAVELEPRKEGHQLGSGNDPCQPSPKVSRRARSNEGCGPAISTVLSRLSAQRAR